MTRAGEQASAGCPLVTVVLPIHVSGTPFLEEAIASVVAQSLPAWELVVVDDASPDPDWLARTALVDERVRVVRTTGLGIAGARNTGLRQARGSLVAFLDYDDAWFPDHLSTTVAALADDPGAVGAFTAMVGDRDPSTWPEASGTSDRVDRHSVLSGGRRPSINALVARREAVDWIGGLDPRFDGSDDVDLIYRLVELGPYRCVDTVTVFYRVHDAAFSRNVRHMARSGDALVRHHLGRAKSERDSAAAADLRLALRQSHRHYAEAAVADAVGAWRAGDRSAAARLAGWALRWSPRGVARAGAEVLRRRRKGRDGGGGVPRTPGQGDHRQPAAGGRAG